MLRIPTVCLATAFLVAAVFTPHLRAHEVTVQGTVAAIEKTRIQVKTGKEKAGESPAWFAIDGSTKIKRGDKAMTFAEARIKTDERVVLILEHPDKGPMKTKEIRLAAR